MTTHIGKIARLSRRRRDEIGRRLENGQPGRMLLKWLNKLKDVKAVLRTQFDGRPVNEPNLTAWRKSGYVEWREQEGKRRSVRQAAEDLEALAKSAGKRSLGNGLAIGLALELDGVMKTLLKEETDPEKRWERVREIHREVSRLRRDDDRVKRTTLREKAQGLRLKAKNEDPSSQGYDAAREDEEYWNQQEPPPQGIEAAREAMAAMGARPSVANMGCEDEDENEGANEDKLRQIKAGQGESDDQNGKAEVRLPRIVERGPASPGCEYVKIKDKTGLWFKEVPKGWQVPADWKSPEALARMRYEGDDEDEGRGINGKGM